MARIVAAMASSHAYAYLEPSEWDERRARTQTHYARRYGTLPADRPEVAQEAPADNPRRYGSIRGGLALLASRLRELRPDAVLLVGDDQDENYRQTVPQFAIFLGERLDVAERGGGRRRPCALAPDLARAVADGLVERGFDLALTDEFPDDALISHAHREPLERLDPEGSVPVVPLFINSIHVPGPTPARCYAFGQALAEVVASLPDERRLVLLASGGLSHFTAGYPWRDYRGPCTLGSICEGFDRDLVQRMREGLGAGAARLTNADLLANGEIELRQWIVLLGAVGTARPAMLRYEPFYRAVMGMAVGLWELG